MEEDLIRKLVDAVADARRAAGTHGVENTGAVLAPLASVAMKSPSRCLIQAMNTKFLRGRRSCLRTCAHVGSSALYHR